MSGKLLQKIVRCALVTAVAAGIVWTFIFALGYISHTYESSASLYLQLNRYCFYKAPFWKRDFFTHGTKAAGDAHCIAGIILAAALSVYAALRIRRNISPLKSPAILRDRQSILIVVGLLLYCVMLWYWGHHITGPAFDEVFSAMNCASMHPLGTLSYYPLPNNHVLFNLLNNLLFSWANNQLVTARILSGFFYAATAPVMYWMLWQFTGRKWAAAAITMVLLIQFPTWGFSFQGRGYALCTFLGWAGIAAYYYHCTRQSVWALRVLVFCLVAGYATVPTFLYFHFTIAVFEGLRQMRFRKFEARFWVNMIVVVAGAYLFYLPAISFCGIGHLINAAKPVAGPFRDFAEDAILFFRNEFAFGFSFEQQQWISYAWMLNALPLLLFFFPNRHHARLAGFFYLTLWLSFFAYVFLDRRFPFMRNLTVQSSFSLAILLLTFWWLLEWLAARFFLKQVRLAMVPVILLFGWHYARYNPANVTNCLYFYDINLGYNTLQHCLDRIPAGASVSFSEEGFYVEHLAKLKGCKTVKCPSGTEDFYIIQLDEPKPVWLDINYLKIDEVSGNAIYQRVKLN